MAKKKKIKVMVSSSVYGIEELLDRIYALLTKLGYEVWMSHKGTVFTNSGEHAFDLCLKAVEQCDIFFSLITTPYGTGGCSPGPTIARGHDLNVWIKRLCRWLRHEPNRTLASPCKVDFIGAGLRMAAVSSSLASALLATLLSSASAQETASRLDAPSVTLPGGRSIAISCTGSGPYTVVLEPGDGGRRSHMSSLALRLSQRYRVCTYDRRNRGDSSTAPTPRGPDDLSGDLFDALARVDERGPFILFGSSMGGLLVRLHAATHIVAGYVTSNQPGTPSEWIPLAHPGMSDEDRALDLAWMAGGNNEHVDVNAVGAVIDAAGPPKTPHVILISTERFQCPVAGICGPNYDAFTRMSQALGVSGSQGVFQILDGEHDLYRTHVGEVVDAIDAVAKMSERKPSHQDSTVRR